MVSKPLLRKSSINFARCINCVYEPFNRFPSSSLFPLRYNGDGSPRSFRYVNFETETEGEYWLIFGGFLLLQREASKGRFAKQRAMGVSSHFNKREMELHLEQKRREEQSKKEENQAGSGKMTLALNTLNRFRLRIKEKKGTTNNLTALGKAFDALQNIQLSGTDIPDFRSNFDRYAECTTPPPSDYFLGFGSSGTQVRNF